MNAKTEALQLQGAAGLIEALLDRPADTPPKGTAVISHPHPLFGGTMDNKVVQTLARALVQCGWRTLRFNFRGVGASAGAYDEGRGELADLLAVLEHSAPSAPGLPKEALALAGFSFGSFVTSHAVAALAPTRTLEHIVLVGTAASRFAVAAIAPELHDRTLVLHGEQDDVVPLSGVLDWARPQQLPVVVFPGAGHFFHGLLLPLRDWVCQWHGAQNP